METTDIEEIRQNEVEVTEILEKKVLAALDEGSLSRRQLSRVTRLKRATVDSIIKSLARRRLVRMVTVTNSTGGKPTVYVTLMKDEEEIRKKRLVKMYEYGI